jgi:chitodextrinase
MAYRIPRYIVALLGAALLVSACTTKGVEIPPLTGPSELSTAITIAVSPDVLNQDGASQSLVTIVARDANGQPLRNLPLRAEISVDGVITDFGRLSARNLVTDTNGRASVTYTAPAPVLGIASDLKVQIGITPAERDFGNANTRFVTIRLVPSGVIGPPTSPFVPDFTPPAGTVGNAMTFVASVSGSSSTAQVATFFWDFDDGDTEVGPAVSHTFEDPGTYLVRLVVVDTLGRSNFVSKAVTVGQGTPPTVVAIIASPSAPAVGQVINFNGSNTTVEAGHRIVGFDWTFGDGTSGSGPIVQHAYQAAGEYTVTLRVTDDVGRESALQTLKVTVK